MMLDKEWYEVLEVSQDASPEILRAQYKKLAFNWHPDKNQGNIEAEEKFKKVLAAYEIGMDPSSKNQPAAYSYSTPLAEHEKADVEKVLRSIIAAINPLKKDIPLNFESDEVLIGEDPNGAQVLTSAEAETLILTLEYLINQIIQPVASSALGKGNQKDYIEELRDRLRCGRSILMHPIYKTSVPYSFSIKNELFKFYLPIFIGNADVIKGAIEEVQSAMLWVNGIDSELKASSIGHDSMSILLICKKGSALSLLITDYTEKPDFKTVYNTLIGKGVKNPQTFLTKYQAGYLSTSSILIPFEDLKGINAKWPMLEQQALIDKLHLAIGNNNPEEVRNLLSNTPKNLAPETLRIIFNQVIDTHQLVQATDEFLEIAKALTAHFKGAISQELKDDLFINAVGNGSAALVAFLYSEFNPTPASKNRRGTVGHNFARRFCELCKHTDSRIWLKAASNKDLRSEKVESEALDINKIQEHYPAELAELQKIKEIIKTMLAACEGIQDQYQRTPAGYLKQYERESIFDEFLKLGTEKAQAICHQNRKELAHDRDKQEKRIESSKLAQEKNVRTEQVKTEEAKTALLKLQKEKLALGGAIGLLTGGATLYALHATTSWPNEIQASIGFVTGFALVGMVIAHMSTTSIPTNKL